MVIFSVALESPFAFRLFATQVTRIVKGMGKVFRLDMVADVAPTQASLPTDGAQELVLAALHGVVSHVGVEGVRV